jgi:hypothetical protein
VDHVLVLTAAHAEAADFTVAVKRQKKAIEFYPRDDTQSSTAPASAFRSARAASRSTFGNWIDCGGRMAGRS